MFLKANNPFHHFKSKSVSFDEHLVENQINRIESERSNISIKKTTKKLLSISYHHQAPWDGYFYLQWYFYLSFYLPTHLLINPYRIKKFQINKQKFPLLPSPPVPLLMPSFPCPCLHPLCSYIVSSSEIGDGLLTIIRVTGGLVSMCFWLGGPQGALVWALCSCATLASGIEGGLVSGAFIGAIRRRIIGPFEAVEPSSIFLSVLKFFFYSLSILGKLIFFFMKVDLKIYLSCNLVYSFYFICELIAFLRIIEFLD